MNNKSQVSKQDIMNKLNKIDEHIKQLDADIQASSNQKNFNWNGAIELAGTIGFFLFMIAVAIFELN